MKNIDYSVVTFWILMATTSLSILGIAGVLIYGMIPQILDSLLTTK